MVGLFVWPSTLVLGQTETMQFIDSVHCNSIIFLNPAFESYNDILDDFYLAYIQQPLSLFFAVIFDYAWTIWEFLSLFIFPLFTIARKLVTSDVNYLTCSST